MKPSEKLASMGITLPTPASPVANYVSVVITGNIAVVSGQLPLQDGKLVASGHLGAGVSIELGVQAARASMINILAQLNTHIPGGIDAVSRIIRLGGFITATPDFTDHAKIMNGASDLAVDVFGAAGRHTRSTIGVPSLPLGAAVEVEAMVEIAV